MTNEELADFIEAHADEEGGGLFHEAAARLRAQDDGWGPAPGFSGCQSCGRPYSHDFRILGVDRPRQGMG